MNEVYIASMLLWLGRCRDEGDNHDEAEGTEVFNNALSHPRFERFASSFQHLTALRS